MINLLVTTDFSARSRKGINHAFKMAKQLKSARITICTIVEKHAPSPLIPHYKLATPNVKEVMEHLKKFLGARASDCKFLVVKAPLISKGILKAAREAKADYIITSSHGYSPLSAFFIGSTTQKIIAASKIPVIVV